MATQAAVLTAARDRLDEPTARKWGDAQLRRLINEGARDIAVRAEVLLDTDTVAAVSGTQEYSLASDVVRVHRVQYEPSGSSERVPLTYRDFNNMDDIWWTQQAIARSTPSHYTLWGFPPNLKLVVYPTPSTSGTLRVYHYRIPAELATDGSASNSTVECPQGWEHLIVDYVEYRALRLDGDQRWSDAKQLYERHLSDLIEHSRRWSDQGGIVTGDTTPVGVPYWLWQMDY